MTAKLSDSVNLTLTELCRMGVAAQSVEGKDNVTFLIARISLTEYLWCDRTTPSSGDSSGRHWSEVESSYRSAYHRNWRHEVFVLPPLVYNLLTHWIQHLISRPLSFWLRRTDMEAGS